uniref:Putative trypsin-like serine protease n=1 Tax=Lutzomyia longipalpis TaxID=7200 RepID=A0A1B0C8Q3_LUTLO
MKAFLLIVFCCVVNFGGWANVGAEFSSKDYDGDNDWGSDNSGSNSECYDADIKEFPFTAALYYNHEFICSATIITRYLAVTPAFCIQDKSYILMDLSVGKTHPSPDEGIHITQAIKHPHFNPRTGDYDIAVLIFERIAFNETIKPMLLLKLAIPSSSHWNSCENCNLGTL